MKIKEGICGAWVISELTNKSLVEIMNNWTGDYLGYATIKMMETELRKYGFQTIRKRAINKKVFEDISNLAIAFIQWEGDYHHWAEEYNNTHYVLLKKIQGKLWVGCSENGWFKSNSEYLKNGYIRSYLIIQNNNIRSDKK